MKLIIVSGRSGSGKTTCLHVLEDMGYYCVDNIPASLLETLAHRFNDTDCELDHVAVSIDARNLSKDLSSFPEIFQRLSTQQDTRIIFLDAEANTLLKRFSETRRKHPLTHKGMGLQDAITFERQLLSPLATLADLSLDTTNLSLHQLRDLILNRIASGEGTGLSLQFQSFGFKNGVPADVDLVFDARSLPNPFWVEELRSLNGKDPKVQSFMDMEEDCGNLLKDISNFLEYWLPKYQKNNRAYITVAVGCTGGQHRSVYLCEKLGEHFVSLGYNAQIRHKELA
jgi:UPF0042 nucleotide-binding protein